MIVLNQFPSPTQRLLLSPEVPNLMRLNLRSIDFSFASPWRLHRDIRTTVPVETGNRAKPVHTMVTSMIIPTIRLRCVATPKDPCTSAEEGSVPERFDRGVESWREHVSCEEPGHSRDAADHDGNRAFDMSASRLLVNHWLMWTYLGGPTIYTSKLEESSTYCNNMVVRMLPVSERAPRNRVTL